jgi:DNA-directed RNA polymerase specialized sigma24 family protein
MEDSYLRSVAYSVGVPEMFLDDCAQEIRIAFWQAGQESKTIARRTAIDFVRDYGRHSRSGYSREYGYIEGNERLYAKDWTAIVDTFIDTEALFRKLPPSHKRCLSKSLNRQPMTQSEVQTASVARKRLRELRAA